MDAIPGRLRWQCRRGMLELDFLLNNFIDQHWLGLDKQLKAEFEQLLCCSDQDLQKWLCEGREADNEVVNIVSRMRQTGNNPSG